MKWIFSPEVLSAFGICSSVSAARIRPPSLLIPAIKVIVAPLENRRWIVGTSRPSYPPNHCQVHLLTMAMTFQYSKQVGAADNRDRLVERNSYASLPSFAVVGGFL